MNQVDLLLDVWLFSRTFWLNVPDAGKQPKLGSFSAFAAFGAKVCYVRCVGGTVPCLCYVHSVVVNAGNVVSKMQKKY